MASSLRKAALKHVLPIGLVVAVVAALALPQPGKAAASLEIAGWGVCQTVLVISIFTVSGLTLKTADIRKALRAWPATVFGVTSILLVTPLLALLPSQLTFLPHEFRYGLLLFCTMPTTINSGVALAEAAKGNTALALLLTVSSNLLGILTVPFFLSLLLSVSGIVIDPLPLLTKLLLTLFVPLVLGKLARERIVGVQPWLKRHKVAVGNTSSLCLILIPWMKLSVSRDQLLALTLGAVAGLLACGLAVHAVYLAFNYVVARHVLRLPLALRKSVVIMCSQKTLPMAMTILSYFPASLGEPGLIAIPCILSHLTQIFVDAVVASKWALHTDDGGAAPKPSDETATATAASRTAVNGRRGEDAVSLASMDAQDPHLVSSPQFEVVVDDVADVDRPL